MDDSQPTIKKAEMLVTLLGERTTMVSDIERNPLAGVMGNMSKVLELHLHGQRITRLALSIIEDISK